MIVQDAVKNESAGLYKPAARPVHPAFILTFDVTCRGSHVLAPSWGLLGRQGGPLHQDQEDHVHLLRALQCQSQRHPHGGIKSLQKNSFNGQILQTPSQIYVLYIFGQVKAWYVNCDPLCISPNARLLVSEPFL